MRNGWINAIKPLLEMKGETLPYPEEDDVDDKWRPYDDRGMDEFISISSDGLGPKITGNDMNSFFFYESNSGEKTLHIPCYLGQVYSAGGGKISLYQKSRSSDLFDDACQAFLWYTEKYYNSKSSDLLTLYKNGELSSLIDKMNEVYSYSQIDPSDVYLESKTSVYDNIDSISDDEELYYYNVFCYKPGCLVNQDGMSISEKESNRVYVKTITTGEGETYFIIFVPYEFHKEYGEVEENAPNKWECFGDELWNFLKEEASIPEQEIVEMRDTKGSIPAKYLKKVLKYMSQEMQ